MSVIRDSRTSSKWEERYRSEVPPEKPSSLLLDFSGLLPGRGLALDVAAGAGRHSVFLAKHGMIVIAVERSREGIAKGRELARERDVQVNWLQADLERFSLPDCRFDLVACFYYRNPELYPLLSQALRPGGLIFYETYTEEQLAFPHGPRNPQHLLSPQELLRAFGNLEIIFYRETWKSRGTASLVARKPGGVI